MVILTTVVGSNGSEAVPHACCPRLSSASSRVVRFVPTNKAPVVSSAGSDRQPRSLRAQSAAQRSLQRRWPSIRGTSTTLTPPIQELPGHDGSGGATQGGS